MLTVKNFSISSKLCWNVGQYEVEHQIEDDKEGGGDGGQVHEGVHVQPQSAPSPCAKIQNLRIV